MSGRKLLNTSKSICTQCGATVGATYLKKHQRSKRCRIIFISKEITAKGLVPISGEDGEQVAWYNAFYNHAGLIKYIKTYPIYSGHGMMTSGFTKYLPEFLVYITASAYARICNGYYSPGGNSKACIKLLSIMNTDSHIADTCEAIYRLGGEAGIDKFAEQSLKEI